MNSKVRLISAFLFLFAICNTPAQTPEELLAAQAGGLKLVSLEMEEAVLPNSPQKWIKLVCKFSTEKPWTDIVSLNFEVIVADPESSAQRLLTGGVSYINIPKGLNTAIMYLTPNTVIRFGRPRAASVFAYRGDQPVGETALANSEKVSLEEKAAMLRFDGAIQNVRYTPWLLLDYGKTPDLSTAN